MIMTFVWIGIGWEQKKQPERLSPMWKQESVWTTKSDTKINLKS